MTQISSVEFRPAFRQAMRVPSGDQAGSTLKRAPVPESVVRA